MEESAKKERHKPEAVEQTSSMLIAQILWGCYAFNASPQEAAQQVVSDLYEHLSRGGKVSVHVEGSDGREHELQVTARRQ